MKFIVYSLFFLSFLLLLSSPALSLEISDLSFTAAGSEVTHYSRGNLIIVHLEFSANASNLVVDASGVNEAFGYDSNIANYNSIAPNCVEENGVFNCRINNLRLLKNDGDGVFEFYFRRQGVIVQENVSLQLATSTPRVSSFTSNQCHDGTCYVSSGINNLSVVLENSDVGFSRGNVRARIGQSTALLSDCEDFTCRGFTSASFSCADGSSITARIDNQRSWDDAGMRVSPSEVGEFICDSSPPVVEFIGVDESSDLGITRVSDSFTIRANVSEDVSPVVEMKVIGDPVNSANLSRECVDRDGVFVCSIDVTSFVSEKGVYEIPVIFSDLAGNEVHSSVSVDIVEVQSDEVPDFWSVGNVNQQADSLTIRNLAYSRDIFLEVELIGDADLVSVDISNFRCLPVVENETGRRGDVSNLRLLDVNKESNVAYLRLTLRGAGLTIRDDHRYADYDTLEFNCGLDLRSVDLGYFYAIPEQKNFTVKFDLEEGYTLDEKIYETIDAVNERVERTDRRLDGLEQSLNMIQDLCRATHSADTARGALGATQAAAEASVVGAPLGQTLQPVTAGLDETYGTLAELGVPVCEAIACESSWVDSFYSDTIGLGDLRETLRVDDIASNLSMSSRELFNPYKSEYVAVATMCLPAFVYHRRVAQGIECNYALCLNEGVSTMGLSVEHCERNRGYDHCIRTAGNVLYALPFTNMFTNAAQDVQNMIRDPAALLGGAIPYACRLLSTGSASAHGACVVAQTAMSLPVQYQRIRSTVDQLMMGFGMSDDVKDRCSPALTGAIGMIQRNWEMDAQREGFGYGRETFLDEYEPTEMPLGDGGDRAMCTGNTCYIYDGDDQLIGRTIMTSEDTVDIGRQLLVYGPEGNQMGYVLDSRYDSLTDLAGERREILDQFYIDTSMRMGAIRDELENTDWEGVDGVRKEALQNAFDDLDALDSYDPVYIGVLSAIQYELEETDWEALDSGTRERLENELDELNNFLDEAEANLGSMPDEMGFLGLLADNNAEDIMKEYINEYYAAYYAENEVAYDYAVRAAEIRWEKARRLTNEQNRRDELQPVFDVLDNYAGRRDSLNDLDWNIISRETGYSEEFIRELLDDNNIDDIDDLNRRQLRRAMNDEITEGSRSWFGEAMDGIKIAFNEYMAEQAERYESMSSFGRMREGALGLSIAADIVGIDNREWRDDTAMGQLAMSLDYVTEPERAFCDDSFNEPVAPPAGASGSITTRAGGGTRPGAFIAARRTSSPDELGFYDYWIQGGVEAQLEGLRFRLVAYDSSGREHDYTNNVAGDDILISGANTRVSFGGFSNPSDFSSERVYEKFCIEFETNRLSDYFHAVSVRDNRLCQRVGVE